jgi:hypothetical protein
MIHQTQNFTPAVPKFPAPAALAALLPMWRNSLKNQGAGLFPKFDLTCLGKTDIRFEISKKNARIYYKKRSRKNCKLGAGRRRQKNPQRAQTKTISNSFDGSGGG